MESNKDETKGGRVIGAVIGQLVLGAVCLAAGWICKELYGTMFAKGSAAPRMMGLGPVTVAATNAQLRAYNLPERFVAHAEAEQEVELLPQIDGYVKALKFKEGDIVKAGQILYLIDDERYRAVVNQRKADLEAAEAEERRAARYYKRMQTADSRGITQLERDNAEAESEKARAAVLQAKANLVVAEYDLKKTTVVAPISGQIGKSSAYVGDYVAPSKGALARIVQIDPIRVTFPLTDRQFLAWRESEKKGGLRDDLRMRLLLADDTVYEGEGKFEFDDNQMSRETATIIVRLSFPNADRILVPNSYLTLLADKRKPTPVVCVPQQAVFDIAGGNQGVYVLKDDQTVEQRIVTVRETDTNGWTPIVTGVKDGEQVVISGISKLRPGAKVMTVSPTANDDLDPRYQPPIKE